MCAGDVRNSSTSPFTYVFATAGSPDDCDSFVKRRWRETADHPALGPRRHSERVRKFAEVDDAFGDVPALRLVRFGQLRGLAVSTGKIYVSTSAFRITGGHQITNFSAVDVYKTDGSHVLSITAELDNPNFLAVDASGKNYVAMQRSPVREGPQRDDFSCGR